MNTLKESLISEMNEMLSNEESKNKISNQELNLEKIEKIYAYLITEVSRLQSENETDVNSAAISVYNYVIEQFKNEN